MIDRAFSNPTPTPALGKEFLTAFYFTDEEAVLGDFKWLARGIASGKVLTLNPVLFFWWLLF